MSEAPARPSLAERLMSMPLRYDYGGHFTSRDVWLHGDYTNPTWEFLYIVKGEAFLFEGEREIDASAGDVLLLAPGVLHGGRKESRDTVSFFWFHFYCDEPLTEKIPASCRLSESTQIPLLCRQLLHFSALESYPQTMADALMRMILVEYAVASANGGKAAPHGMDAVCEWIRINSDRRLSVREVADRFGYHEDYLCRLFRRKKGRGLKEYIDEMRMERIRTLLLTTDAPLKEIARLCGFEDYKAFLKFFSYHETLSPTSLRESYYKTHTNNR